MKPEESDYFCNSIEMVGGQRQRINVSVHARTAHKGPLQKRLEEDLHWIVHNVPPTIQPVKGLNWTELTSRP